jgi:hypothetical protein
MVAALAVTFGVPLGVPALLEEPPLQPPVDSASSSSPTTAAHVRKVKRQAPSASSPLWKRTSVLIAATL